MVEAYARAGSSPSARLLHDRGGDCGNTMGTANGEETRRDIGGEKEGVAGREDERGQASRDSVWFQGRLNKEKRLTVHGGGYVVSECRAQGDTVSSYGEELRGAEGEQTRCGPQEAPRG